MAGKAESIAAHPEGDWDSPFRASPGSSTGEFSRIGANPVVADLNAKSFSESSRSPLDGDQSRSQGKFPTANSTETS